MLQMKVTIQSAEGVTKFIWVSYHPPRKEKDDKHKGHIAHTWKHVYMLSSLAEQNCSVGGDKYKVSRDVEFISESVLHMLNVFLLLPCNHHSILT